MHIVQEGGQNLLVEWKAICCILSAPVTVIQLLNANVLIGKSCMVHVYAPKRMMINMGLFVD